MALANSRGLFDYDERISKYWPEFAQQGKDKITVRQHAGTPAGLFAFDETGDKSIIADLDGWRYPGEAETGVGAWNAAGIPCLNPWILRKRTFAQGRSQTPKLGSVLSG